MEKYVGGSIAVICGSILFTTKYEMGKLKRAVNELIRLNDALRIKVTEIDGTVNQEFMDYREKDTEVLAFDSKSDLSAYAEEFAKIPLDLFGDLCEFKIISLPDQSGVLIRLHHIIGDAWTLSLLCNQLYDLLSGRTPTAYSYAKYIQNESAYLSGKRYEKDKKFFMEQFGKCDEVTFLSEKTSASYSSLRKTFVIDHEKARKIIDYAASIHSSPFMLFTASLAAYINRTKMNAECFYIGTAVLNRSSATEKNTAGMFINTVPVLIELANELSFHDNLSRITDSVLSVFRHQKFNYGDLLAALRSERHFEDKLYDVMISYQNATVNGECETAWYHSGMQTESLQIHIDDRDNEGIFRIHYDYLLDRFTEKEIETLHCHLMNLLFGSIEEPSRKIGELTLLSPEERQRLLYHFNDTAIDYPKDKCVHQLFEERVSKTPEKIAVIACDRTMSYAELNEEANRIAHGLIEQGVKRGDIVAFCLPRRSFLISAILGILKAGAGYLPIDPDYPQDRVEFMLSDSGAKYYLTEDNINDLIAFTPNFDKIEMNSNDFCYCLFTSGTTGKPKATVIQHYNVANFTNGNNRNFYQHALINISGNVLALAAVTFDISVLEIFNTLLNGLTLTLANETQLMSGEQIGRLIANNQVDAIHCTPTKFSMYLDDATFQKALKQIKVIMIGAEVFPERLLNRIKSITDAAIFNGYGPTETTIGVCFAPISSSDITIGRPIANTQIYIVDKYMNPVPIGVTGELCIAGDGVGAGYLNRPELTAERFVDNPFGKGKLYKTGDLAYWREDGNIVYVGRNDFQVKIRGMRIELGEIENAISSIEGISQAVVVVRKNDEGRQLICAFYTGQEIDPKEIRAVIGRILPKYMIPHIFTHLDAFPLTSSGKVSRKALPEVDLYNISTDTDYVAPHTELQKALCGLMEKVLQTSPVGIDDDFFDLGGDSLTAIEFVSNAHYAGIYFNLQNMFDHPTVRALADCIENEDSQSVTYADYDFSTINRILAKNTIRQIKTPEKSDLGNILIAGATGFLGIHLLADYLDNDSGTAFCLVRGKNADACKKRLHSLLHFYFGEKYNNTSRIKIVCADLQKDRLGLSEEEYNDLLPHVSTVFNSAASVKHFGSYQFFYEVNVATAVRLIDFCKAANARLIHISTSSVSGNGFRNDPDGVKGTMYEHDLYMGQALENVYVHSKFEAEKAVLEAMCDGLQANIMRMGNLSNRYSDGVFQKNYESNANIKRLKAILELGVIPRYLTDSLFEFTPIDEAAKAVMTIARHFSSEQTLFYICSSKTLTIRSMISLFNSLDYNVQIVSENDFIDALRTTATQSGKEYIFETFINDLDENYHLNYGSNIQINSDFSVEYLKRLGFEWKETDAEYIRKYVAYFRKIGYFN